MTAQDWLACTDPKEMLARLSDRAGDRKLRLFGCGCCRRLWRLLGNESSRGVVEVAERRANGGVSRAEMLAAMKQANVGRI
jgi:hypothetical protein